MLTGGLQVYVWVCCPQSIIPVCVSEQLSLSL